MIPLGFLSPRRTASGLSGELPGIGSPSFGVTAVAVGLLALVACSVGGRYVQVLVSIGCAYVVSALGYNLVLGYAKQMAFGQAGFMAVGAYTFAVLQSHGVISALGFLAAITASGLVAVVIGVGVLRTRHFYLGLVTLAFAEAVLVLLNIWPETHGENGIGVTLLGRNEYYFAVGLTLVALVGADRLVRSRFGRAMAMVSLEGPAAAMGVPVARTRIAAFVWSGVYGGAGGILLAGALLYITPSDFSSELTLLLLAMIVVGGLASIWGTVAGVILLTILPQVLSLSVQLQTVLYGAVLFLVLVYRPHGLISAVGLLRFHSLRRWRA